MRSVRPERLQARRAVSDVAVRTALLVSVICDRCGPLPRVGGRAAGHSEAIDHAMRYLSHRITVQALNTTVYRHPSRIAPTAPPNPESGS